MCSNTIAVFLLPLGIGIMQFSISYNYRWTITLSLESSRLPTSRTGFPGTGLVSHKLTSHNMSISQSLFFSNCYHPNPSYVTYLKSLFKYVKFISFSKPLIWFIKFIHYDWIKNILKYSYIWNEYNKRVRKKK